MAFIINEQKQIFGMSVNSLYCRVLPKVNVDGKIYASPILYINKEAYQVNQILRYAFDVMELHQKYSEKTGLLIDKYIETPVTKELSSENIYVGTIENKAQNYLQMATNKVINHLVEIKFIKDKINVEIQNT